MRSRFSNPRAIIAPLMPVTATAIAASAGTPPICSAMLIAIGSVDDFGASDISVPCDAPSTRPMTRADTIATVEPTSNATPMGSHIDFNRSNCAYSGMASATVAGPIRKCTNFAPSKYTG